jgi:hypothetical protein
MNEFCTTFRGVPELGGGKRMNAAATSVASFEYRHLLPGAPKLARSHQARATGADDDDVFWLPPGHAGVY